ncbi:MAG: conjugal transfer protein TraF [Campylobacterota bacterium]|nr:conjugal transfer protein TraF [Campylobacterota bacterium]
MSYYKLDSIGKKRLLSLALLGATSSLFALGAEHAYLYKDPRIMGMGGANVAVGAYSTSVFSNPAGLTNIKKEHGIVVDLVGIGISVTADALEFADDVDEAGDDSDAMTDVIEKYNGKAFHTGFDNYTSISKNSDAFAWSIGLLAAVDNNFMTHSSDLTLEASSRGYGGVILGVAKSYDTEYGKLDVGMGAKYISQISYEGKLDINDLTGDEDVADILQEKYEKESTGFGIDIGVVYHPLPNNFWHPAVGMSIMNLGSMGMDDNYGHQPTTVNIGASISPEVKFIDKLVVAVDYIDMFDANKARFYNMDETIEDVSESDMMKRIRLGVGLGLIDTSLLSLTLNGGIYQSAYTAGVELEFLVLKLSAATYEEEIGTGSATNPDRRYMAKIGIGW